MSGSHSNASTHQRNTFAADTLYLLLNAVVFIVLFTIARGLLLWRNNHLLGDIPLADVVTAFATGFRFDLIMSCYALAPLVIAMLLPSGLSRRRWCNCWLIAIAFIYSFLAALELDFYREFHARLNSLVFQYVKEDPKTVVSMLWYGFPVLRYLALCVALTGMSAWAIWRIDRATRKPQLQPSAYGVRLALALVLIFATAASARGTFRSGPPLRWADAYKTEHLFTNHLALNGSFTLLKAAQQEIKKSEKNPWLKMMPDEQALALVRENWLTPQDQLLKPDSLPLFRHVTAARHVTARSGSESSPYKNVVLIIDESFSAQRTGVFGNTQQITPRFDELAREGLSFERFFSQGTHTHQGMFATAACFPNLPHYEYLMKQPQGSNNFSGITKLLAARGYESLYVYNGDFAWDNQSGFFRAQNMQRFIGRHDFVNPRFSDRTWGVSDEDMFDRGFEEIVKLQQSGKPYFVLLQTLSNHAPYALPPQLPMPAVEVDGVRDEHLTAMRYNDYALGVFFDRIKQNGSFDNTLFVFVGDHGFGGGEQITDIDLWRFHVPLVVWGKDIQQRYGKSRSVVGSQVDIAPTIMGILGGDYEHHCWGRDLLSLSAEDQGRAFIKPSGTDFTTAFIEGDKIIVQPENAIPRLYHYTTLPNMVATPIDDKQTQERMNTLMNAYIQTATRALIDNRVGHGSHVMQAADKK